MTNDEYVKRLMEIIKGVIVEAYLGGGSTRTSEFAIPAIRAIQALNNEAIGEDFKHMNGKPMKNPAYECPDCGEPDQGYTINRVRQELRQIIGSKQ